MSHDVDINQINCPTPHHNYHQVLLGHGSGGRLSAELLEQVFLPELGNPLLAALEDSSVIDLREVSSRNTSSRIDAQFAEFSSRIAFTTDSFVVKPLFFAGGDIGKLAVNGTVNDLAVMGAEPILLSAAFIIEEGFAIEKLRRIAASMRESCQAASVRLVTGDTKVVDRGKGDELFITTSGIGLFDRDLQLSIRNARAGDKVLLSGSIGDHGISIMSEREGIEFETALESDTAPLHELTRTILATCPAVRLMRDPTRGGLSSTLHEIAKASRVGIRLEESAIPVRPEVHAACEMFGLDPLQVANEGKLVAVVPERDASQLLRQMRMHPLGRDSAIIGEVVDEHPSTVVMRSPIGGMRVVTMLAGEQLPRIC